MHQQNKKNGNLILIKNRRILTRTQQSKQKLQVNLNSDNFPCKTPRQKQSKIIKYPHRNNYTEHKVIQKDRLDQSIFWKKSKKKLIRAECDSQQKTQSLDDILQPRNYQKANDRLKAPYRSSSRVEGILKGKIFSHKNLSHIGEKIRSNTSVSTLRINNDCTIQNEIPSDNTQRQESQRETQRTYFIKGIKDFTKRFKTENVQPEQNIQKVLKSIYSSRRRKLRLNSNEYSVQLRLNKINKKQKQHCLNSQQDNVFITERTQNKKSLMKLPKQLISKIKQKSDQSEAVSSPLNLSFSSDNDNIERKNFNLQQKKVQIKNYQSQMPYQRQKSKTLLSNELMARIEQQNSFFQKNYHQHQLSTLKNQGFFRKQVPHIAKIQNKKSQTQIISIQDIEVCMNQSQIITAQNSFILRGQKFKKKTIEKNQSPSENHSKNLQISTANKIGKKNKKIKIKQELSLKSKEKSKIYEEIEDTGLMQQINLTDKEHKINTQVTKKSLKSNYDSLKSPQILKTQTIEIFQEQNRKKQAIQNQQKSFKIQNIQVQSKFLKDLQIEKQKQEFLNLRNQVQTFNCIGQVGGQCSQQIPKKNLTWMAPILILYIYCLNYRKNAQQKYKAALKSQLCSQTEYQEFVSQNQQLQSNIQKIYQKAKKKNLIDQQIQVFVQPNFDFTKSKKKFLQKLFSEIFHFTNLLIKNSTKNHEQKKQILFCGIKMIFSFVLILKFERLIYNQIKNYPKGQKDNETIKIPQIDFQNLDKKKAQRLLEQLINFMKIKFEAFDNKIES